MAAVGRVHGAGISAVNKDTQFVSVEWFENGETKGKEVSWCSLFRNALVGLLGSTCTACWPLWNSVLKKYFWAPMKFGLVVSLYFYWSNDHRKQNHVTMPSSYLYRMYRFSV